MLLLPRPRTPPEGMALPWWDIPARMLVTLALVAVIMLTADALGPQLSGIVSTYPVILTVVGTFTHQQWGRDAVRRVLRGVAVSLTSFVAFFLVVGLTMPTAGVRRLLWACQRAGGGDQRPTAQDEPQARVALIRLRQSPRQLMMLSRLLSLSVHTSSKDPPSGHLAIALRTARSLKKPLSLL